MIRVSALLLCGCALAACDHFQVNDFAGSKIVLSIASGTPTAMGHHVELWARRSDGDVARLLFTDPNAPIAATDINTSGFAAGLSAYVIVQAVDIADACMIDGSGNLLWQPAAQVGCGAKPAAGGDDTMQRMLQAASVETRIHQLTDKAATPLYALASWDDDAVHHPARAVDQKSCDALVAAAAARGIAIDCINDDAPDAAPHRLSACDGLSRWSYVGNPLDLTAPLHGIAFGMLDFLAVAPNPSQVLGGIQIISYYALDNLAELWFSDTDAQVANLDPNVTDCSTGPDGGMGQSKCRGTVLLDGRASAPDRGIYRFPLSAPAGGASGSAAVYTQLDQDPVSF
jgi:hypothetical protein